MIKSILVTPGKNLKNNQHLQMLYHILKSHGYEAEPWSFSRFVKLGHRAIWHIHWTDGFYRGTLLSKGIEKHYWWLSGIRFLLFLLIFSIARLQKTKVIWSIHNVSSNQEKKGFFQKAVYKILLRYADKVTAYNKYIIQQMSHYGNREIILMRRGTYEGKYPNEVDKSTARKKLGIPKNSFVFLIFGHILPYKGVDILVQAFQKFQTEDVFLIIAGSSYRDPNYGKKIQQMIESDKRIIFHDQYIEDNEVQYYFCASDYTVYPYRYISHSGVLFLSITFGIPFIVCNKGGVKEIVDLAPEAGILVEGEEEMNLLKAMKQAKDKQAVVEAISFLRDEYRWEKIEEDILKVFEFDNIIN
jgi:glycosyltransferase involved in cell wall biosynthesis